MKYAAIVAITLSVAAAARPAPVQVRGLFGGGKGGAKAGGKGLGGILGNILGDAAGGAAAAAAGAAGAAAAAPPAAAPPAAAAAPPAAVAAATTPPAAAAAVNSTASATASNSTANSGNEQTSLTLDPSVIAPGFAQNGQAVQEAGQVASLTSTNNFINFCATVPNVPLTNGQQVKTGSCNPAPMGIIAATTNMPSAKFVSPTNGDNIPANQPFTVTLAVSHLSTGNFVNAQQNYFSAPQQVDSAGDVTGHSHIVIEQLSSATQTTPTNPNTFAFFKGLNAAAVNGQLTADVTSGLPPGTYRVASINTAANHQPVLVAVAQHGSLDDMVYFTAVDGAANSTAAAATASNSTAAAATASNSTAAAPPSAPVAKAS